MSAAWDPCSSTVGARRATREARAARAAKEAVERAEQGDREVAEKARAVADTREAAALLARRCPVRKERAGWAAD